MRKDQTSGPDRIRTGGLVLDRDACSATTPRDPVQIALYPLSSRVANHAFGGAQGIDQRLLAEGQGQIAARFLENAARTVRRAAETPGQRVGIVDRDQQRI